MILRTRHPAYRRGGAVCGRRSSAMSCSAPWTATMAKEYFADDRSWSVVKKFMDGVVAGQFAWDSLTGDQETGAISSVIPSSHPDVNASTSKNERTPSSSVKMNQIRGRGKQERKTYKLTLAYSGPSFNGWSYQPGENHMSTCEELRRRLRTVFPPPNALIVVASGRTDDGVYGHHHVASFYSWDDVPPEVIAQAVNQPDPPETGAKPHPAYLHSSLRCIACQAVPRSFHATFACRWRRYLYLMPLNQRDARGYQLHRQPAGEEPPVPMEAATSNADAQWAAIAKGVDGMLGWLEGRELDYYAFGRSTPKGRSCLCRMLHVSAKLVYLPGMSQTVNAAVDGGHVQRDSGAVHADLRVRAEAAAQVSDQNVPVVCVQLVADRFVRRMVRTLVSTAVMSTIWDDPLRLQQALAARERRDTAYPAPASGLCFTGAGYDDQPPEMLDSAGGGWAVTNSAFITGHAHRPALCSQPQSPSVPLKPRH